MTSVENFKDECILTVIEFEKALLLDSRQNGISGSVTVATKLYAENLKYRDEVVRLNKIIKEINKLNK